MDSLGLGFDCAGDLLDSLHFSLILQAQIVAVIHWMLILWYILVVRISVNAKRFAGG